MLLDSRIYGRRSGTSTCIPRLKTSVWKRQSFKITASACNLREELGRAHRYRVLQVVHNHGLKCSARSSAPTKSRGRKERSCPTLTTSLESNFYIKAAAIIDEHVAS